MKKILTHLSDGGKYNRSEAKDIMLRITEGEFSVEQLSAFLMALNMRNLEILELLGFRDAMLDRALKQDFSDYNTIDIVGTGGDGKNTFNISTCTSFVVAGAGYKVAKHGSYGVSSISGSANVLQELGVSFTNDESILKRALDKANICFLHAPSFHPAMKHVVPTRKALGIKTIFNILGPLLNPTLPQQSVLGVYSEELADVFASVLAQTPMNFQVVFAMDGYDEVSLTGDTLVVNKKERRLFTTNDFLSPQIEPSAIFGGHSVPEAATIFRNILENIGSEAQKQVVLTNAALAIQTFDLDKAFESAKAEATEALESGKALEALKTLIETTN